jgi:small nuclear ribonucleoprotein F
MPSVVLHSLVGERVAVKSKWGPVYTGVLVSTDAFMNLQLRDAVEETSKGSHPLGEILLRCNNVLYIRQEN